MAEKSYGHISKTQTKRRHGLLGVTDFVKSLKKVRKIRNRYLHLWSQQYRQIENDAVQVLREVVFVITASCFSKDAEGQLSIKPKVMKYLAHKFSESNDKSSLDLLNRFWVENRTW